MVMMPGSDPRLVELKGEEAERRLDRERAQQSLEAAAHVDNARKPSLLGRLRRLLGR